MAVSLGALRVYTRGHRKSVLDEILRTRSDAVDCLHRCAICEREVQKLHERTRRAPGHRRAAPIDVTDRRPRWLSMLISGLVTRRTNSDNVAPRRQAGPRWPAQHYARQVTSGGARIRWRGSARAVSPTRPVGARYGGRRRCDGAGNPTCLGRRAIHDRYLCRSARGPADPMLHQRGTHPAGDKDARGKAKRIFALLPTTLVAENRAGKNRRCRRRCRRWRRAFSRIPRRLVAETLLFPRYFLDTRTIYETAPTSVGLECHLGVFCCCGATAAVDPLRLAAHSLHSSGDLEVCDVIIVIPFGI